MPTRERKRGVVDVSRVGAAVAAPGIDTRTWVSAARVDDTEDAIRWDADVGWIVDVTLYGGDLEGEGPLACRVAQAFAGNGNTSTCPIPPGCEVQVIIPGGDPNANPVIVGFVHNGDGCVPPTTVNGQEVNEELVKAFHVVVSAFGVQEQYAGDRRIDAANQALVGALIELAEAGAAQSFVRGEDQKVGLDEWRTGATGVSGLDLLLSTFAGAIDALAGGGAMAAAFTVYQTEATVAFAKLQAALSARIKGE